MSIGEVAGIFMVCSTTLACTWRLSGQIQAIESIAKATREDLKDHVKEDKERFEKFENKLDRLADRHPQFAE